MIQLEQPADPLPVDLRTAEAPAVVDEPIVADEDAAFAAWYRNEHPRLLATMTIVTRNLHVAQDVTAEAFARALASWKRVSTMDSPTGWTYRVAVNLARRRARRAAIEERLLRRMTQTPTTGFGDGIPVEHAIELWDAVRALPPRARTAIALRYTAGLTEAEIAAAMNVAVGTASATLASARRTLAAALSDSDAEEPHHG
jgi:RNA polymerase sigma-70 factor (ECF subfamily)